MKLHATFLSIATLFVALAAAQQAAQTGAGTVPQLIHYSGIAKDVSGKPLSGVIGITFLLYQQEQGGSPLWLETQNVQADSHGHYSVQLGATLPNGVPNDLFVSGEARWLGIQIAGQSEAARVMLLSVPYAMKAGDAQTLGGLPASAFVLAPPMSGGASSSAMANAATSSTAAPATTTSNVTTTGGTVNAIPLFTTATNIQNSAITQTGTGTTARIGIGTATPAATLDVKGAATVRGALALPPVSPATKTTGSNSQPVSLIASSYSSSTSAPVNQTFQWQAEFSANDTAAPSGSLNLLFGQGNTKPSETGLHIASNGLISFASAQTFPGAGTITGVTAGSGLTGGGSSGAVTLNLDPTKVPMLAAGNTFSGNQTVNGNLSATGLVTGSAFNIGSNLFDYGSYTNQNALLGFAGNTTMTGGDNTAAGYEALANNSTGIYNTASGVVALYHNTSGGNNTAHGYQSLYYNTTGSNNVAVGYTAGNSTNAASTTGSNNTFIGSNANPGTQTALTNATAIGANAQATASNALVLGSINGVNGATASTNVGIGTTAPAATLDVHGTGNFTGPITFAGGQTFPGTGTVTSVVAGSGLTGGTITSSGTLSIASGGVTNAMLQNQSVAVTAGPGLTGGGAVSLGGSTALNLDTTQVPLLGANNGFSNDQVINGLFGFSALTVNGWTPSAGSGIDGEYGLSVYGGNGDPACPTGPASCNGGNGITAYGGAAGPGDPTQSIYYYSGPGGYFVGGSPDAGGVAGDGVDAFGGGGGAYAGYFSGFVYVTGEVEANILLAQVKNFKIDHPLDPAHKYLVHASVESSEMKNLYDGVAVLDASGAAVISLPDWFTALNKDFRYQLTSIGAPGPNLYVSEEVSRNHFSIAGGQPGAKVSWQITGVRQDAFAQAHPIEVEQPKAGPEVGHYLSPELFGAGPDKSIDEAWHPGRREGARKFQQAAGKRRSGATALSNAR